MPRNFNPEKGKMEIQGHSISYEMVRSKEPSVFGIQGSRIFELNVYKDGTLILDFDKKWLIDRGKEDEIGQIVLQKLLDQFGQPKAKKEKQKNV